MGVRHRKLNRLCKPKPCETGVEAFAPRQGGGGLCT